MTASKSVAIHGIVTDGDGRPVVEAAVAVVAAPGPMPDIAALTDSDGRFAIAAPMTGEYTIVASAPGSGSGRATVHVDAAVSETTNVGIQIPDTK